MSKLTYNVSRKKYILILLSILIILLTILTVNYYQDHMKDRVTTERFTALSTEGSIANKLLPHIDDLFKESDYVLYIEKIGISTPIMINVDGSDEYIYDEALKKGVAHLKDSSTPEQAGNIVVFGHSSQVTGAESKYGDVFARLDELSSGDKINIVRNDRYVANFTVYEKNIVDAHDVSIVNQTDDDRLTIFTCWPIGTDEKRLVVVAKLEKRQ